VPSTPAWNRHRAQSIVVVGGGLAGLVAALDLVQRGYDVKLLEAKSRAGGRILTIRPPWREGLFVEAGATFVVPEPDLLALFHELEVELEHRPRTSGLAEVRYFAGKRSVYRNDEAPSSALSWSPDERALGTERCMAKYFAAATTFDPSAPLPAALAPFDAQTVADYLRKQGASPGFISSVDGMLALGDTGVEGMSALSLIQIWASVQREVQLGQGAFKVRGGTDRLTAALTAKLADRVVLEAVVDRIEQTDRGARVSFTRQGERAALDADRVILAVPAPVLRALDVAPGLSPEKRRALEGLSLESVTRAWVATDDRFWIARSESGNVESDLPLGGLRDESDGLPGTSGILGIYATRAAARELASLPDEARDERVLHHAEVLQPGVKDHIINMASKSWDADPFQRGAYAWYKPNQLTAFGDSLARAEGRLHFAGDHTSYRPGFMHGALASARRVVREIAAADT
jgi:monoamine oxidase